MAEAGATRWGILSAGNVAHDFAAAIRSLPREQHAISAVAARDLKRAQDFAKEFDIHQAYGSYKELAQDTNVEVVYIATLHPTHAELSKLMLNHGKHVVCEKPFTMNSRQAREVIQLAKEKKLFFMEGFWTRFFPVVSDLRRELALNSIGDLKLLLANFGMSIEKSSPAYTKEEGAGALIFLGCYCVMMTNMVFGIEKPEKIVASAILQDIGVDEVVNVAMHFSKNRMATFTASAYYDLENSFHVFGSKGSFTLRNFWCPEELTGPDCKFTHPTPRTERVPIYPNGWGMMYEVQGVRESLIKGELESPLVPHEDSLWIMEVMDEIRRQIGVHYDADDQ